MKSRALFLLLLAGLTWPGCLWLDVETLNDYHTVGVRGDDALADDRLEDKKPPFDPDLLSPQPFDGARLNLSAAVLRLDVPPLEPDADADLLVLHSSYADACAAARDLPGVELLPSVNLIDGKARQIDDGLYAALDLAYYRGLRGRLRSHVDLVRRLYERVNKSSPAAPFLVAGLELAGVKVPATGPVGNALLRERFRQDFQADEVSSRPVGFYTWGPELKACFRFLRYFQKEFGPPDLAVPRALAAALAGDPVLLADYRKAVLFYARLSNPGAALSVADLLDSQGRLCNPWAEKGETRSAALFPASTSREAVLFERLFPRGLPADASLMAALIRRIRSGEVDLHPRPGSGWYEHQVHALETLLVPEKGPERDKLLLTRAYKKRTLEAFEALLTKRRETHIRVAAPGSRGAIGTPPLPSLTRLRPRLRVEPCPGYYLRTARAYAFLANFLESALGKEALQKLHGLRQGGRRKLDLYAELHAQRELFYGLYLVCAEDVGLKPAFAADEAVERARCRKRALAWLAGALDPDLAVDTRVAVPVCFDRQGECTRLWATLGVRLAKLEVSFARPPHVRWNGEKEWQEVEPERLEPAHYLLAVDEFAEVELPGVRVLPREQLRAVCDRHRTRQAIVTALQGM